MRCDADFNVLWIFFYVFILMRTINTGERRTGISPAGGNAYQLFADGTDSESRIAYIPAAVPPSKEYKKRRCIPCKSLRIHPLISRSFSEFWSRILFQKNRIVSINDTKDISFSDFLFSIIYDNLPFFREKHFPEFIRLVIPLIIFFLFFPNYEV